MSETTRTFADETASDRSFDELVELVTAQLQAGQDIDEAQLAAAYPQHLARLQQLLPTIRTAAYLLDPRADSCAMTDGGEDPTNCGEAAGVILGDYQIVREIGRGGMGVVYEARQLSLNRTVALKVLAHAVTLDARQLARFKNEARAAATLEHPHIVPVYGVGSQQRVHYYAMQLIRGRNLAQVLRERANGHPPLRRDRDVSRPSFKAGEIGARDPESSHSACGCPEDVSQPGQSTIFGADGSSGSERFRSIATLGVQVADALHHAHENGVVHRDVKPSNLLLDSQGKVWVADFGLARTQSDVSLTTTGDRLGTARYMSPEQARGQGSLVGHRSDLYSLGVTLYELVTLQPAFSGEDQQALLYDVIHEEPPRPRGINRLIPADLETIVLKAMAKDSADRYASGAELADDLRRFLEQRPILARPPSLTVRLHKWLLRHRAVSLTVAASAICLIVVLGVASGIIWRALGAAQSNLGRATTAAQHERDMAAEARQTVNDMYTRVAAEWLSGEPRLQKLQQEFLEKALGFYERLARDYADDDTAQAEVGQAQYRVGEIRRSLGQWEQAGAAYRAAADTFAVLDGHQPDPAVRVQLAKAYLGLGHVEERQRYSLGEAWYGKSIDMLAEVVQGSPDNANYRFELAYSMECLAWCYVSTGRFSQAVEQERRALEHLRMLSPEHPSRERCLIYAAGDMADWLHDSGKIKEAEKALQEVIPGYRQLAQGAPRDHRLRYALARALERHAKMLISLGRYDEALTRYEEILALRRTLAADFPDIEGYNDSYVFERHRHGQLLRLMGRRADAEREFRETIEMAAQPQFAHPDWVYAELCRDLGAILAETARLPEAKSRFQQALVFYERYFQGRPDNCFVQSQFALFLANFPNPTYRDAPRAVQLAQQAVGQVPTSGVYRHALGVALFRASRWRDAVVALSQAAKLHDGGEAADDCFLAMAHHHLGDAVLAQQWHAKAIAWMQENKPGDGELRDLLAEVQALLNAGD